MYTAYVYSQSGDSRLSAEGAVSRFASLELAEAFINGWYGNGFIELPDNSRIALGKCRH